MKRPQVLALLLAVVAIAGLGLRALLASSPREAGDRSIARQERRDRDDAAPTSDLSAVTTTRASVEADAGAPIEDSPFAGDPAAIAVAERPLVLCDLGGSAVRIDPNGVEHTADSGSFVLSWQRDGTFDRQEVEVVGGSWSARVPVDVELRVWRLVLADSSLQVEESRFAVPQDRFRVVVGREQQGVLLHVLSPAGAELDGVEVWAAHYSFNSDVKHPGAGPRGKAIVASARSPVVVPPGEGGWRTARLYFVRAPGYAWATVAIDHAGSGERTLTLAPSCRLAVELVGSADWLEPEIHLWPSAQTDRYGAAFAAIPPDDDDRAAFEDLPPGDYDVSVDRGWGDERVSFGSASVTLLAGDQAEMTVEVDLPERPAAVRVSGTLTLPNAWDRERIAIELGAEDEARVWGEDGVSVPLDAMRPMDGSGNGAGDRLAWEAEVPTAGPFRLEVLPLPVRQLLDVPEEGLSDVDIVVPPPADVSVRVVEDETGDPIDVGSLHWSAPPVDGILSTTIQTAVPGPETGRIEFRTAAGKVHVSPSSPSFVSANRGELFTVAPGDNEIELRVRRQLGARFLFKDGDAAVPWDWSWRLGARQVDGDERDRSRSIGILWFREPGLYELTSEGIPGYASVDGTTFRVEATGDGMVDVVVQLTPE
ncbi:MAG: hypothetical protein AAGB93_00780 [Planctomycetota bacterium]